MATGYLKEYGTVFAVLFMITLAVSLTGCTSCEDYDSQLREILKGESLVKEDQEVADLCGRALKKCPDLASAYQVLGSMALKKQNYEDACNNFIKAVENDSENEALFTVTQSLSVAFTGQYLAFNDDGKIVKKPFHTISLREYAGLNQDIRMSWCVLKLGGIPKYEQKIVFTDRQGREIDSTTHKTKMLSPSELDKKLMEKAIFTPDDILHKAAFIITAQSMSFGAY